MAADASPTIQDVVCGQPLIILNIVAEKVKVRMATIRKSVQNDLSALNRKVRGFIWRCLVARKPLFLLLTNLYRAQGLRSTSRSKSEYSVCNAVGRYVACSLRIVSMVLVLELTVNPISAQPC